MRNLGRLGPSLLAEFHPIDFFLFPSESGAVAALEPFAAPLGLRSPSSLSDSTSFSATSSTSSSSPPLTSSPPSSPSLSPPLCPKSTLSISNHIRVQNLVAGLATRGITVTEWGAILYRRLGVPVVYASFDFLVDDEHFEAACAFTEEQGYRPTEHHSILLYTHGEYEAIARHFDCFGQRVNFYPGSFAGFRANELCKVPLDLGYADAMPVSVFSPRPAALAASFVRIIGRVHFADSMSLHVKHDLCQVLTYCLFDMSYEGDYMVLGEESQEEIDRQINRGLDLFRKWEGWRDDEMWIADALEAIIQGKGKYHYLPSSP